MQYQYKFLV